MTLVKRINNFIKMDILKISNHALDRLQERLFDTDLNNHTILDTYEVEKNGKKCLYAVTDKRALLVLDYKSKKVITIIQGDKKGRLLNEKIYRFLSK